MNKVMKNLACTLTLVVLMVSESALGAGVGNIIAVRLTGTGEAHDDNGVIYGDGKFARAAGPVRLSGAVNLSQLNSDGLITFDCVFIIDV